MWIEIAKDTFQNAEFKSLNYLFQILTWSPSGEYPRYNIFVDTEKIKAFENFKSLSSIEKSLNQFLESEFNCFINSNPSGFESDYFVTYSKTKNSFNVEEAIYFFNQPVSIILENNRNDSHFIIAIINHFGTENGRNKPLEHLNNGWIEFENAGGCSNIPNFMEAFLSKFNKIANKNKRSVSDYFRGIIIFDSDKEYINQMSKQENIVEKLKRLGLERYIHVLQKRMMENYLPKEVFQEINRQINRLSNKELKNWLEAYLNLTSKEQLDFINIANGNLLGVKPQPNELNKLWGSIGSNYDKLDKGFKFRGFRDNGGLKSEDESSFKNEMPNWFRKPFISKKNLLDRDGNGELEDILNKIKKLL
jgi:hypothetical protein